MSMPATLARSHWRPAPFRPKMAMMGNENGENNNKTLGLSLLSATTVFSAFSAFNPSIFTLSTFSSKPEARERAMPGLWLGLGASLVGSAAIGLSFGEWTPAVVGGLTGALLFGISLWAIHRSPTTTIPPIERQEEVAPAVPAAPAARLP